LISKFVQFVFGDTVMKRILLALSALAISTAAASAADLAPKYTKAPPAPPPPPCIWRGLYIGLNLGGDWNNNHNVSTFSTPVQGFVDGIGPGSFAFNSAVGATGVANVGNNASFIGGAQIGYNWAFPGQSWLVGVEADIQGVGQNDRAGVVNTVVGPFTFGTGPEVLHTQIVSSERLNYLGTVRGRIGFLPTQTFLLYGTGGLAYGGVKAATAITQTNNDCVLFPGDCISPTAVSLSSLSQTRAGWTAGIGGEWMFAPNWSAKFEWLYYDLGHETFNGLLVTSNLSAVGAGGPAIVATHSTANFTGNIARVGVNYHFNWGGPAYGGY
jgi:outer membrane immunogenic protein